LHGIELRSYAKNLWQVKSGHATNKWNIFKEGHEDIKKTKPQLVELFFFLWAAFVLLWECKSVL
jgi:hypothetical protein